MKTLLSLLTCVACASCSTGGPRTAVLRPVGHRQYEVTLTHIYFGLGGPCTFPFDPRMVTEHQYLYTPKIAGEVPAERLRLYDKRPSEEPGQDPVRSLQGSITFAPDGKQLDIHLQEPRYDDGITVTRHVPFEENGHYVIKRED